MPTGTIGMVKLISSSSSSKPTAASVPTGTTLLAELASPLNSVKPDGRNFKKNNDDMTHPSIHNKLTLLTIHLTFLPLLYFTR